jgi:hypothetical protein
VRARRHDLRQRAQRLEEGHYYARDGYTVIIHGKHHHEETLATASQALTHDGGQYLCVRDVAETELVCDFIRGTISGAALMSHFREAASPGSIPTRTSSTSAWPTRRRC